MAVKESQIKGFYELENPFLKGVKFSEQFPPRYDIDLDKAVEFAHEQGGILESAREAAGFRIEAERQHNDTYQQDDTYHLTISVVLGLKINGRFYTAIDDTINPEQNIALALAKEGFKSSLHKRKHTFILPITHPLVKGALLRAEKTGRIVEAAESITLDLKTKQNNGKSEFGQYDWTKATFLDMAEPYAQMLNKRGYDIARVGLVDSEELEYIGIDNTNVEVRLTVLGRIDSGHIHDAYSCFRFMEPGRARVVHGAREFSTGDKGKIIKLDEKVFAAIRKMYE